MDLKENQSPHSKKKKVIEQRTSSLCTILKILKTKKYQFRDKRYKTVNISSSCSRKIPYLFPKEEYFQI